MIARVEPLTLTRAVRGPFDYLLPPDHEEVRVGSLLRIPFGAQRPVGVVVELAERSELSAERLVAPEAVLPVALPADLVALARWMAREYCSTEARALATVLPPGGGEGVRPRQALMASITDAGRSALDDGQPLTGRQRELLGRLARAGESRAAELGTDSLRRLESRGLVEIRSGAWPRRPRRHPAAAALSQPPALSDEQRIALEPVLEALADRRDAGDGGHGPHVERRFLLHGVTGSGKTEVYLRAVAAALEAGRSAIVLVPEIALTPQALERFHARLGEVVAVIHSGLGRGERFEEWQRLARGEARVCVGARSAIFAPLQNIGLIVVDEEHESSYKHEGDPRYDARRVAEERAREHGAVLLAGSATPRPESAFSLPRLRLRRRVDGRPLPPVEVLDMRERHHALHPETSLALADLRRSAGKGILLLNRRGWSNFLSCRSCGRVWLCPNCDVTLVLHRVSGVIACHHCGHRQRVPSACDACGSVALARHGSGTEQLEHELAESLGERDFPVLRLDADAAALGERARTLAAFAAAPAGLLVGTQMIAKGHDFPDVALGVVLDADRTLRFPDFRAEERTFALVTQLAGRAGRGGHGRVLVQTLAPQARSIAFAARHDSDGFLADELERRRALLYPPFSTLIRIVCAADEPAAVSDAAAEVRARLDPPAAAILGPAPLFRLRGRSRAQIVIKARDRLGAIGAVGAAVEALARPFSRRGVSVSVDVDPQ